MKIKLLSALIASAFAGVATTASAGVIQASYKNYASEVFGTNAVSLTAPTVNYALALPLSGTPANPNSFTISWTLPTGGEFVAAPPTNFIQLLPVTGPAQLDATPTSVVLSADRKTLTAGFTVTTNYSVGAQIVLGAGGPVAVTAVGTILGAPAITNGCGNDIASVEVAVRLQNAAGSEFDSNFPGASNTTPIVQSSVAVSVTAKDSATYTTPERSKVDVLIGSLGLKFTTDADVTLGSISLLNIGSVNIANKTTTGLFDLNGTLPYSTRNLGTGGVQGVGFGTNPNTSIGIVEANSLKVDVSGSFLTAANGGSFFASTAADCTAVLEAGTIATDGKSATVTLPGGDVIALAQAGGPLPVYMCYATNNTKVIPTSQFAVTGGSLGKFANSLEAPNPVCPSPIYNLQSNGVKVDVRNYIPQVATNASGWYSVVRIINTDDQQTVSPVIQALLASGVLGASTSLDAVVSTNGTSGPFKPREVRYYTTQALDAALGAASNGPTYGAADVGGNARLRISAPSSSLRVQNYVYNPATGNFVEASAAQSDEGPAATQQNTQNNR